jgi:hypothetical protein
VVARLALRRGELRIIAVTPVARGVVRPVLAFVTAIILSVYGVEHVGLLRTYRWEYTAILVVPAALLAGARIWRWRSHKLRVTSERIIAEGGALRHWREEIELVDVVACSVDQRLLERLTRRGLVVLETSTGPSVLGLVRHPAALCRVIDQQRRLAHEEGMAFDTVFDFDPPPAPTFEPWRRQRDLTY